MSKRQALDMLLTSAQAKVDEVDLKAYEDEQELMQSANNMTLMYNWLEMTVESLRKCIASIKKKKKKKKKLSYVPCCTLR
jgi:uncharacterized protein YaaN involved in tellurite resistance